MYRPPLLFTTCVLVPMLLAGCGGAGTAGTEATGAPTAAVNPFVQGGLAEAQLPGGNRATAPSDQTRSAAGTPDPGTGTVNTAASPDDGAGHTARDYYGAPLPAAGGPTKPLQVGCDWFRVFDAAASPTQGNTAFPDTAGIYWIAAGPTRASADTYIEISGHYPAARYFSFQAYDGFSQLKGSLVDYLTRPSPGSVNPFRGPSIIDPATQPGGAYVARLAFTTAPGGSSQPAPNTLYRGSTATTILSPTQVSTALIYRVYLPAADATGGVGLPQLVLHSASGDTPLAQSPDAANCRQIVANFLAGLGSTNTTSLHAATDPPTVTKYFGVAGGLAGQGTAKNGDTSFLYARTKQATGDIVMVRGRAPTYAQQPDSPSIPDVRYWSICQNNYSSQQVVACVADRDAVIDRSGYYNIVISAPDNRPASVTPANGYNWLRWGVGSDAAVLYRNMLASPAFTQSVQAVPRAQKPAYTMEDYAPQVSYCNADDFQPDASPAQAFANCQASDTGAGNLLGGLLGGLTGLLGGL